MDTQETFLGDDVDASQRGDVVCVDALYECLRMRDVGGGDGGGAASVETCCAFSGGDVRVYADCDRDIYRDVAEYLSEPSFETRGGGVCAENFGSVVSNYGRAQGAVSFRYSREFVRQLEI